MHPEGITFNGMMQRSVCLGCVHSWHTQDLFSLSQFSASKQFFQSVLQCTHTHTCTHAHRHATHTHSCTPQATAFSSSVQKATKQMPQHLGASCGSKTPQTTQSHSCSPAPHSCLLQVQENLQSRPWKNCPEHHRPSL